MPNNKPGFWHNIDKRGPKECWLWEGACNRGSHPYGRFGKGKYAHRVMYEHYHRMLLPEEQVLHVCDNPKCVNPAHLFVGDRYDNMRDMAAKGRQTTGKLKPEQVKEIRALSDYWQSVGMDLNQTSIGKIYGIHQSQVSRIVHRKAFVNL